MNIQTEETVYGLVDQPQFFNIIKHQIFYFQLLQDKVPIRYKSNFQIVTDSASNVNIFSPCSFLNLAKFWCIFYFQ